MLVYVAITMSASPTSINLPCRTSYECSDTTPCCRDDSGRLVGNFHIEPGLQNKNDYLMPSTFVTCVLMTFKDLYVQG